jgi:hypothetical protein
LEKQTWKQTNVGFEVLTAVVMKSSIFWDIMPRSPLKVNDASEEHVASIVKIEEEAKQETIMKHVAEPCLLRASC